MTPAADLLLIAVAEITLRLDEAGPDAADRVTPCDPWTVRDVLAHCSGSMLRVVEGRLHQFTPEDNEIDVAERRAWPLPRVRDELRDTAEPTARHVDAAHGRLDGLALGVWVHAGDIRQALGIEPAYRSPGADLALGLLEDRSRRLDVGVAATIDGTQLTLGSRDPDGRLSCNTDTFVRLVAGRDPGPVELIGYDPADLLLFT
ncbi:MAG: maleylpyruvate isomerase family mycothiol-dependent enzyme [Acidimicrobiia bacterium]|nr:maleylpyruvate isomerase family mycothiol-dependent enzyme [Acidimicrobiia bacterium]